MVWGAYAWRDPGLINPLNLPSQAHPRAGRAEADLRPSGT